VRKSPCCRFAWRSEREPLAWPTRSKFVRSERPRRAGRHARFVAKRSKHAKNEERTP
jgi:hypothetical protein